MMHKRSTHMLKRQLSMESLRLKLSQKRVSKAGVLGKGLDVLRRCTAPPQLLHGAAQLTSRCAAQLTSRCAAQNSSISKNGSVARRFSKSGMHMPAAAMLPMPGLFSRVLRRHSAARALPSSKEAEGEGGKQHDGSVAARQATPRVCNQRAGTPRSIKPKMKCKKPNEGRRSGKAQDASTMKAQGFSLQVV